MSLQINLPAGTRDAVLKHLAELSFEKLPHGTDKTQIDAVKALVSAEINALPSEVNGVRVILEATSHQNGRTGSWSIFPVKVIV